jgi:hypothetical protein
MRRKAAVLVALKNGEITVEEACLLYGLSEEELRAWQSAFDADGLQGLRATGHSGSRPRTRSRRPKLPS